jgi:thioredoxin reductase
MPELTAVIGAGPYGLSVAAHLREAGVPVLVLGKPMEFWQNMPPTMSLKSPWSASSLADPGRAWSLDRYSRGVRLAPPEPIPLPYFLEYGRWFQRHAAPDLDATYVRLAAQEGDGFRLELADGRRLDARRVVVAVGIQTFAHTPEFARDLPPEVVCHTQACRDFSALRGRTVAVVGSGQSALEWAALLHESGAHVEVIARGPVHWVNRKLYDYTGPARHVFYPPTDVGPPGINWLVAYPLLVRRLPPAWRSAVHRRSVRPAGAKWLRSRVEGQVRITARTGVRRAQAQAGRVRLELTDGSIRELDHLVLGTGYHPDIDKIGFLDPALRQRVVARHGFPVLNRWFESSVPNLHFAGGVAGYSFGPLCNFVAGAKAAAQQIARRASQRT